jgi:hypothetical protein
VESGHSLTRQHRHRDIQTHLVAPCAPLRLASAKTGDPSSSRCHLIAKHFVALHMCMFIISFRCPKYALYKPLYKPLYMPEMCAYSISFRIRAPYMHVSLPGPMRGGERKRALVSERERERERPPKTPGSVDRQFRCCALRRP